MTLPVRLSFKNKHVTLQYLDIHGWSYSLRKSLPLITDFYSLHCVLEEPSQFILNHAGTQTWDGRKRPRTYDKATGLIKRTHWFDSSVSYFFLNLPILVKLQFFHFLSNRNGLFRQHSIFSATLIFYYFPDPFFWISKIL